MTNPAHTPPAFIPVIRVLRTKGGIDAADYCARLVRAFVPHLDSAGIASRVAAMQGAAVAVAEPAELKAALPAAMAARLQALADRARATAESAFASLPDALLGSTVTVISEGGAGFPVGTVVWLREGAEADLQFIFPQLVADVATASFVHQALGAQAGGSEPRAARAAPAFAAMPSASTPGGVVTTVAESTLEVASSVSWALPPPWNVGVTAGLSLLQILLKATDKPDGPSPMDRLKQSLEDYLQSRDTDKVADHIRLFNEDLLLKTAGFTFAPDQVATVGTGALQRFDDWWNGPTGIFTLEKHVNEAISSLERAATLEAGEGLLEVACAGVTAWTTGMKISMQLAACKLSCQLAANDANGFTDGTASWRTIFEQIQDRLFDMAGDEPGKPAVQGWASRVQQWMDRMRADRLAQLHVARTSWQRQERGPEGPFLREYWGWRFSDDADGETDHTTWKHLFADTFVEVDACHSTPVEHKEEADRAMSAAVQAIEAKLKTATGSLSALHGKVTDIANLQPPRPPKNQVPKVALMTSGTATPAGLWTKGAKVSYQIAFVNDGGLSDPGPPTPELEIGDVAGATISDIPQDPNALSIQIFRNIVAGGSKTSRVAGVVKRGTLSFTDVRTA